MPARRPDPLVAVRPDRAGEARARVRSRRSPWSRRRPGSAPTTGPTPGPTAPTGRPRSPQPHTVQSDVDDVVELIAAAELPTPMVFVAHSYGGLVARPARPHSTRNWSAGWCSPNPRRSSCRGSADPTRTPRSTPTARPCPPGGGGDPRRRRLRAHRRRTTAAAGACDRAERGQVRRHRRSAASRTTTPRPRSTRRTTCWPRPSAPRTSSCRAPGTTRCSTNRRPLLTKS